MEINLRWQILHLNEKNEFPSLLWTDQHTEYEEYEKLQESAVNNGPKPANGPAQKQMETLFFVNIAQP